MLWCWFSCLGDCFGLLVAGYVALGVVLPWFVWCTYVLVLWRICLCCGGCYLCASDWCNDCGAVLTIVLVVLVIALG